jgi:hypothetical protein
MSGVPDIGIGIMADIGIGIMADIGIGIMAAPLHRNQW